MEFFHIFAAIGVSLAGGAIVLLVISWFVRHLEDRLTSTGRSNHA